MQDTCFFVGTWIGKRVFEKRCEFTNNKITIYLFVILIISLIAFTLNVLANLLNVINPITFDKWTISRLLFLPLSFSLTVLLSGFFNKVGIEKTKFNRILLFLGSISFELYLFFERVLSIVSQNMSTLKILSHFPSTVTQAIFNLVAIGCTVLLAYLLSRISKKISSFLI